MKAFKVLMLTLMLILSISAVFAAVLPNNLNNLFQNQVVGLGSTASRDDFRIDSVKVNDITATSNKQIRVERGTVVPVEVEFTGTNKIAYDTRIKVYLGGYEYGDVEVVSGIFEVRPGDSDSKTLKLVLPEDLEASDYYTLNVEMYDDDNSVRKTFKLRVEESRHSINVFDVIFNPTNNVQAGSPLFATVRVENLGDNIENTVKVTLSIPSLNLQTSQLVDRLVTDQDLNEDDSGSRRVAATTNDMVLFIPEDTPEGDYRVVVKVEYNRYHDAKEQNYVLHVKALSKETPVTSAQPSGVGPLNINVDTTAQRVAGGQGAQYKFSVVNLGQTPVTLSFEVLGVADWAASRLDPETVTVASNSVQDVRVFVAPVDSFEGAKTFTVKVKQNNNVIAEKTLSVEVVKQTSANDTLKKGLGIAFAALLAVLVLLGIALLIRKLTQDEEKPVEGQTYY